MTHWSENRGREQQGNGRAKYGDNILQRLSQELSAEFGKGFNHTNLE
ncbi:hypothetical protein VB776_08695 [Arcicella sp. DC2W]|uniref:YhcG N-terminal domain-containing protein n=1 Tax=Arcicella gelida TaxID=2984195 RepID=A0ABU5S3H5_9BACT|nr:hypothetical protein [Arcicella sp. DC2W]MEA5402990.1 hypothetical protein [Arcicella sp. DC2W]